MGEYIMLRKELESEILILFNEISPVDQGVILLLMRWRVWLGAYYLQHWQQKNRRRPLVLMCAMFVRDFFLHHHH